MKTTVELPDHLMVRLKVIAAEEHRRLREVMAEVISAGIEARGRRGHEASDALAAAEAWLQGWHDLGDRVRQTSADPRSLTEIVLSERR